MRKLLLIGAICLFASSAFALTASLPWALDFEDSDSIDTITRQTAGNGSIVSRVQGSWRGASNYVFRIDPPNTAVPAIGNQGGYACLTNIYWSATPTINIAFAVNFGTTYNSSGSAVYINKFIDVFNPTDRTGLLNINDRGSCEAEWAIVSMDGSDTMTYYAGAGTTYATCTSVHIGQGTGSALDIGGKWVWVNYKLNSNTGTATVKVWDQTGAISGVGFTAAASAHYNHEELRELGGYFNSIHPSRDENSRILIDDLMIQNTTDDILPPTGFVGGGETVPPVVSNPLPTGAQAYSSDPQDVTLEVTTDENATCRMSTLDIAYLSMTDIFTTTGTTAHSETKSLAAGTSYTYYVRCADTAGNATTTSTVISFSIAASGGSLAPSTHRGHFKGGKFK